MNSNSGRWLQHTIIVILLTSCGQITSQDRDILQADAESRVSTSLKVNNLVMPWLDYADPKAEANLAIQKNHFYLLGLTETHTLPGISDDQAAALKLRCGYRILSTGDISKAENDAIAHQDKTYKYVLTYNELISKACIK